MSVRGAQFREVSQLLESEAAFEAKQGKARRGHGIPDPRNNVDALYATVAALKEQVEILSRLRGYTDDSALFVRDFDTLRNLILRAPDNDSQHGVINGVWKPLGYFKPLKTAPSNPVIGQVVFANGTNWNPGSGEGLYVYKSGGWTFIA